MEDQYVSATTPPVVQPRKSHSCSVPAQLDAAVVEKWPAAHVEQADAAEGENDPVGQPMQLDAQMLL